VFLLGFLVFATSATQGPRIPVPGADAIVVLTGADKRIEEGGKLLNDGRGRRLLISGVNPQIGRDEIRRMVKSPESIFDCCVDVGYLARDTTGNADETRDWVRRWRFRKLIVVTSSWHMPRSLVELARTLPGVELVPYPVVPKSMVEEPWWVRPGILRRLAAEYLKLIPAAARYAGSRLLHPAAADGSLHASAGLGGS
jgi:uncharacterized SAM-binding protein YcdF (DUF218 family)